MTYYLNYRNKMTEIKSFIETFHQYEDVYYQALLDLNGKNEAGKNNNSAGLSEKEEIQNNKKNLFRQMSQHDMLMRY
jgi:hypothetical protein